MQQINIGRDNSDPSFRYKMPVPVAKREGRNTLVTNLAVLARKLARPPDYLITFWSIELRRKAEVVGSYGVIKGHHSSQTLLFILNKFIAKYVLCPQPKCRLPETDLVVEGDTVIHDCRACGHSSPLNMGFQVAQYILKHPMPAQRDSVCTMRRVEAESFIFPADCDTASALDDWAVDASEEAAHERAAELTGCGVSPVDVRETETDDVAIAIQELASCAADDSHVKELVQRFATNHALREAVAGIVFEALIRPEYMLEDVKRHASTIASVTSEELAAQKLLLGCIERHCATSAVAMRQVPHVLMALYQADALPEEVILHWNSRPRRTYVAKRVAQQVRAAAVPFIEWLMTADEEDSE